MAGLTVEVVNLDKVINSLSALGGQIIAVAGDAAHQEADRVFPITQEQVPVNTHALQNTGRVEEVENEGDEITVSIAYGDADVDYALVVHEDLEAKHPHGKAKYVEDPVREELESGRSAAYMGAEIKARLGL